MREMEDFKKIADDILKDISVSQALKEKTLQRCLEEKQVIKRRPYVPVLVSAACLILVIGIVRLSGFMMPGILSPEGKIPEGDMFIVEYTGDVTLAIDNNDNRELIPEQSLMMLPEPNKHLSWEVATIEEAQKNYGNSFQIPEYIPEGFSQNGIYASGVELQNASKITISYSDESRTFMIIEEKTEWPTAFSDFDSIDINGVTGFIKIEPSDASNGTGAPVVELHWFSENSHNTVMGNLTKEQAIQIARSMK